MEYDYHGTWDGYTGHNAPLFVSSNDITPERKSWNIVSDLLFFTRNDNSFIQKISLPLIVLLHELL